MTLKTHRLNAAGIQELRDFLIANLKLRDGVSLDDDIVSAWAQDAEQSADNGNPPMIELRAWESLSGATQTFTVSGSGVEVSAIDDAH